MTDANVKAMVEQHGELWWLQPPGDGVDLLQGMKKQHCEGLLKTYEEYVGHDVPLEEVRSRARSVAQDVDQCKTCKKCARSYKKGDKQDHNCENFPKHCRTEGCHASGGRLNTLPEAGPAT